MDQRLAEGIANRLRQADTQAVELLVAEFHRSVYRFLICRGTESRVAEELTAETFYQLVRSFPKFRGDDNQVRAFVYATTRNVLLSYWRQTNRIELSCEATGHAIAREPSPLQSLLARERNQQLAEAIEHLTDAAREIVLLRFVEDLSISEISSACDLPVGTVKSHLHRAKQELKGLLLKTEDQR